jgi:hypothetical protein
MNIRAPEKLVALSALRKARLVAVTSRCLQDRDNTRLLQTVPVVASSLSPRPTSQLRFNLRVIQVRWAKDRMSQQVF